MKKKLFLIFLVALFIISIPTVQAVDITGCQTVLENVKIDVKIANIVHTIIVVIKIIVPIIVVVVGMIDLIKAVIAQKEDEIKKNQKIFFKRLISAALIFFVIQIVQLVISFAAGDDADNPGIMDCASCFLNGADKVSGVCK